MGMGMKGVRGSVKALDCVGGQAVVGTKDNEVYVVDMGSKEVRCATQGHCAELWGLATHPSQAMCVTAGDDKLLRCWDLAGKAGVSGKVMGLPYMGRSLAMSPDGRHVAVGFKEGATAGGDDGLCDL